MKRNIIMFLVIVFTICLFGCGGSSVKENVKVIVPQGNPFIAVGNLVGEENIEIENVNGAAGVKAALVSDNYDIIIAPLNLGAQLYNAGNSKYKLEAVIALGNTYIVSKEGTQLNNLQDLEGKTILAYSQGGTPDIVLQYILNANNINANIEYQPSLSEVVPFFVQGKYDYILAAEPVITNLIVNKKISLNILDLQDYTDNTIMQAAVFVNPDSVNKESIEAVIKKIKKNIELMNKEPGKYAEEIILKDVYFSDLGVEILTQSIPNSNLEFLDAKENKQLVEKYLTMIGYKLPNEEFYN